VIIGAFYTISCLMCCDENKNNQMEHYDARISGLNLNECGTECTKGVDCVGFGYNPTEKKCYLSKSTILGEPSFGLYKDEYSKLNRVCNKINRITDSDRIDGNTLTQNSVYMCADGMNNVSTRFQYANLGATSLDGAKTTIYDSADIDYLSPENVSYTTYDIKWPKKKEDIFVGEQNPVVRIDKEPSGFIESDREFLGQYMTAHQCVVNVPMYDCLKFCENKEKCVGTEWNRSLIRTDGKGNNYLYENVCCPKSVIKKIIPRRDEFNRGKFYVKKNLKDIINRDRIVVTKSDFRNKEKNENRISVRINPSGNVDQINNSLPDEIVDVEPVGESALRNVDQTVDTNIYANDDHNILMQNVR